MHHFFILLAFQTVLFVFNFILYSNVMNRIFQINSEQFEQQLSDLQ